MFDVRRIRGCAFLASAKTSFVRSTHELFLEHIKEELVVHYCYRSYMIRSSRTMYLLALWNLKTT